VAPARLLPLQLGSGVGGPHTSGDATVSSLSQSYGHSHVATSVARSFKYGWQRRLTQPRRRSCPYSSGPQLFQSVSSSPCSMRQRHCSRSNRVKNPRNASKSGR
jgi:hypothetical protein